MPARIAVVGHVEWVEFIQLPGFPARGGITAGDGAFTHAGGGAVVAAAVLAELGHPVDFFCALGRDADGEAAAAELSARGITVHAAWRPPPTRRVVTLLEPAGERTIITLGERIEPHGADPLAWERIDEAAAVYVTAGDAAAVTQARRARTLVATPRARDGLQASHATIDALVYSRGDADERRWAQPLIGRTRLMVETEGAHGGRWWGESEGRWPPVALPGPRRDDYGCGDAFAAGLTAGLADGLALLEAAGVGAERGAEMLTRVGAP
ncbi:MAG TPA: PfkB family carbohydrate kinase [Solirubrobacteraceae bacterium]|nr:PfkB family carbohydrate kinase [Solirubrobacteraceae bacterium]